MAHAGQLCEYNHITIPRSLIFSSMPNCFCLKREHADASNDICLQSVDVNMEKFTNIVIMFTIALGF